MLTAEFSPPAGCFWVLQAQLEPRKFFSNHPNVGRSLGEGGRDGARGGVPTVLPAGGGFGGKGGEGGGPDTGGGDVSGGPIRSDHWTNERVGERVLWLGTFEHVNVSRKEARGVV